MSNGQVLLDAIDITVPATNVTQGTQDTAQQMQDKEEEGIREGRYKPFKLIAMQGGANLGGGAYIATYYSGSTESSSSSSSWKSLLSGLQQVTPMVTPPRRDRKKEYCYKQQWQVEQEEEENEQGAFQINAAVLQQLFNTAAIQRANSKTTKSRRTKMMELSAGEKARMLRMCGLPDKAGDE